MNLKQLEYFVQVAELGSFSRAAVVLDIAQPALSRQVRSLETELNQQLFLRNGRGVALTEAGKRLFDHGVAVLQLVTHAREDLEASRDKPVGQVTIGLPPSFGHQLTLPLIDRFRKQLPGGQAGHRRGAVDPHRRMGHERSDRHRSGLQPRSAARARDHAAAGGGPRSRKPCSQRQQAAALGATPADERAAALPPDRAGAGPCHAPPARDAGGSGRHQARHRLGGVERAVHHRPGSRRLRSCGAHRQRRGGVGAIPRNW